MPQFLVMLHDGTDAEAPARRQATRPAHLAGLTTNVAAGKLVFGGPLLDDTQKPTGSFLLVDCADRAELDAIIANDPYTKGNVWQTVDVRPVRLVVQDRKITP
jgi:uncharacterized protein YciI